MSIVFAVLCFVCAIGMLFYGFSTANEFEYGQSGDRIMGDVKVTIGSVETRKGEKMDKDTIYRQQAIDAMISLCDDCDSDYCGSCRVNIDGEKDARKVLKDLPSAQPEQRWIPVSERLPEIGREVLLSEPNAMLIAEYRGSGNAEGLWVVDECHHYLADVNKCAWMPLPEPYGEDGEADDSISY